MIGRWICSLLMLFLASRAWADAPAWCKAAGDARLDHGGLQYILGGDDPHSTLPDLIGALCKPDDEAKTKTKELEATRQKWSKQLHMTEDDWADATVWATHGQGERNSGSLHVDNRRAWSSLDAIDQFIAISGAEDANYAADALGAKLSETGRLGFIQWCLGSRNHEAQWATCAPDIAAFDWDKIGAELRADKSHDGYTRFMVRLAAYRVTSKLVEHAQKVKQAREKDPAFDKMFAISDATRKDWEARAGKLAPLLALAATLDDARATNSRKAYAGCDEKTWPAWKAAVAAIPAKKFGGIEDRPGNSALVQALGIVVGEPAGYLASVAHYVCHAGDEKPDPLIRNLGEVMQRWPGFRGARNASVTAIMTAGLQLDERGAKIDYPEVYREWFMRGGGSSGGGEGTVASVKPQGDKALVTFATKMEKQQQCANYKRGNRITQIRGDGTLVYESTCLKYNTVTVNRASDPRTVQKRYAEALKPGMSVSIIEDVVAVGWPKPGAPVPSAISGVAVK